MSLLDRYIARQFLMNVVVLFTLLFTIIIAIDFSLNFDEYVKVANRLHEAAGTSTSTFSNGLTALYLVVDLWWPRLFLLYNFLLALVLIGAMGFTCAQLNRHREFVAILAGGLSLHRVARPILIAAALLTGISLLNKEVIIPHLAPMLTREKWEAGSRSLGVTRQPLCADAKGRLFYAKSFDLDQGVITGLWVWERDSDGLMTRRITADTAKWDGHHWLLTNGLSQPRRPGNSTNVPTPDPIATLDTDLDPTALKLRRFQGYSNNLSTRDLSLLIQNYQAHPQPAANNTDRLERIRYGRVANYLCTLLLLLVCLPFYIRREPGNLLLQALKAAPITLGGFLLMMIGTSAPIPGLPPQLSVFLPVMVLIPLAIAAVTSIRT